MKRLILMLAAAALGCSDSGSRRIPAPDQEDLRLPQEIARVDTGTEPISPIEQAAQPAEPEPKPRPARKTKRPAPPPPADIAQADTTQADTTQADTTSAQGYAPDVTAETKPDTTEAKPDTLIPANDSVALPVSDTAMPDTVPPPPIDSGTAPFRDTMATRAAPPSPTSSPDARALPIGTEIRVALDDSINSRHDTAGRIVSAHVMENVVAPGGGTVIQAGAPVRLTITKIEPAKSKSAAAGKLAFRVDGIAIGGELQKVKADVRPVPHELRGRGVTAGDVAKVGVGTAGGAVLGRVLGGNTRGAVIGGVIGAAGGAVVASQTASRDVVVKAKTPVVFVLTEELVAR